MDTWTYKSKAQALSNDSNNCVNLRYNSDPTQRYKAKLVALLRVEREIDHLPATVEKVVPDSRRCSNLLRLSKDSQKRCPSDLPYEVSSIGIIRYEAAKYINEVIGPRVGKTQHNVKNCIDFVQKTKVLEEHHY